MGVVREKCNLILMQKLEYGLLSFRQQARPGPLGPRSHLGAFSSGKLECVYVRGYQETSMA